MIERDIEGSSRFKKIQKQTMLRLMSHVNKERVKAVLESLR